jgi:hypothetical protein
MANRQSEVGRIISRLFLVFLFFTFSLSPFNDAVSCGYTSVAVGFVVASADRVIVHGTNSFRVGFLGINAGAVTDQGLILALECHTSYQQK